MKRDQRGRPRKTPRQPVYDLDLMSEDKLREFLARFQGQPGHLLFPSRPWGYSVAVKIMTAMAHAKLDGRTEYYEMLYKRLPDWAKFRQDFLHQILEAVADGKQFRKRPKRAITVERERKEKRNAIRAD